MNKKPKYYLVTIKGHDYRYYSREELEQRWADLRKKIPSTEWSDLRAFEVDSRKRMHLHVYCKAQRAPFFPKLQIPGWSHHFQEFPPEDINNVYDYLNKHKQSPHEIQERFNINQAENEYCFT